MKWLAFSCLLLAACGGSDSIDLTGIYQVTADVGSMPCGTDQPVGMAPAYLHFTQMTVLGQKYYAYEGCSDAAATMCDGTASLLTGFTEPISHGWKGQITTWSGNGGTCSIGFGVRTAIVMGPQLAIEIEDHSGEEMLPDAQCTDQEAQKAGPSLPCVDHEHIDAMKL